MKNFLLFLLTIPLIVSASQVTSGGGSALSGLTTNRVIKATSSSTIGNTSWSEDSSGYLSNNSTNKGTVSNLMLNLGLGNSVQSGFFLDASFNRLSLVTDSTLVASAGANPEFFIHGSPSTVYMSHRILGGEYTLAAFGSSSVNSYGFRSASGATESSFYLRDSSGNQQLQITTQPNSGTQPRHFFMSGPGGDATAAQVDFISVSRGGGMSLGGETNLEKLNLLTLKSRPDWTMSGTTTANASTTITGSSTNFLEDVGLGDQIALSSASSTFATVTAIASATSMTVDTVLGNGTSQSIIRRQSPLRIMDKDGSRLAQMTPSGLMKFDKAVTSGVSALSDGATPALDASLGNLFTLTSTTNPTIAVPTNATDGQRIIVRFTASGASRTLAFNSGAGGFNMRNVSLSATADGKTDYVGFIYNSTSSKWDAVSYDKEP